LSPGRLKPLRQHPKHVAWENPGSCCGPRSPPPYTTRGYNTPKGATFPKPLSGKRNRCWPINREVHQAEARLSSQARRRHARPVALAVRMTGDSFLSSPPPLLAAADQCLRRPPDVRPDWNRHLATAFRSPKDERPFPDGHSGIEAPGLLLRYLTEQSTEPFGSRLLRSPRLAPVWARSAPLARSLHPTQQPLPLLGSPLPFGAFWTPPDRSVLPNSRPGGSPSEMRPLALRSPPPVLLE